MPHSSTKGRFLEKCLKSDKVRKAPERCDGDSGAFATAQVCNALMVIIRRQAVSHGGTHSALLRSALLPSPASPLPRDLVSGRHLPLSEAVGWPRPPRLTACPATPRHCPFHPFLTLSMRHPISVSQSSDSMRYAMLRSSCDV